MVIVGMKMPKAPTHFRKSGKLPLPEACLAEAMAIIACKGLEALSLRDVARRLGVSHQAPYKHFRSRDHLLAEVIRRCLKDFADTLRASAFDNGRAREPEEAMRALGGAYLDYAARHPLAYRLMFATPWPPAAHETGLASDARAAFDVLKDRLAALSPQHSQDRLDLDAMFVWSSMHGIASAIESDAMRYLNFDEAKSHRAVEHVMNMVDTVIFPD